MVKGGKGMPKNQKCMVDGCDNPVHAKGYCRKHYGQLWRKGRIYSEKDKDVKNIVGDDSDRIRALQRELKRAETMYKNVIGFDGRIKWRREIEEVKKEMVRLGLDPKELSSNDTELKTDELDHLLVGDDALYEDDF